MELETIKALAATPPPKLGKLKIFNIARANVEIARLEVALGLPPGENFDNLHAANIRVAELEQLKANKRERTEGPDAVANVTPPLAIPALEKIAAAIAPAKNNFGLAEIEALHRAIFPGTDAKLRNDAAWSFGADELKAASQKFTAACNQHGPHRSRATLSNADTISSEDL